MVDFKRFQDKKIAVAVSGGADSVALLHYLKAKKGEYGYSLLAVHCEHGIRGEESLEDMRFVQALCAKWEIPLRLFRADCPALAKEKKVSLETAARQFRYACFEGLLKEGEADFVATAHHSGDEAETVLFRLARGSALSGARGIQEENGGYIRPILSWTKGEVLAYIRQNGLSFQEDSTNFELDATRNKLRLEVLPKLEEAVPGARENLARFAALAAEDDGLLQRLSEELLTEEQGTPLVKFSAEKPLFTRACLTAMKRLGLCKDYTSAHLLALYDLQALERGAVITLPKGVRAEKALGGVRFYLEKAALSIPKGEEKAFGLEGFDGGRYAVKVDFSPIEGAEGWRVLRADFNKIPQDARFRFRREGDFIYPFGGGKKSLKKFFNEKKVPVKEREYLPLIACEDGEVYAVCGVEISEKVAVGSKAKESFIALRKKEGGATL